MSKTPNNFEEKIEKELKSLQDSVMNTSEPYIYQEDFDIERKESLRAISTLCEEEVKRAINFDNLNYKIPRTFVLSDTKTGDLYQFDPTQQVIHSMGINMSKSYEGKLWLLNPAELKGKE